MAIFEDFEEIALLGKGERRKPPIIQDQELDASERLEKPGVTTIAARERQRLEESGNALIEHASPVPAGLVAERAGDPAFADPCRPRDQKSFGARDPIAADELLEERPIDAAGPADRPSQGPTPVQELARGRERCRCCHGLGAKSD